MFLIIVLVYDYKDSKNSVLGKGIFIFIISK